MFHTDSIYLLILGSGLLGGIGHCSGMCGPLVATYSLNLMGTGSTLLPHILYNLGRITTYSILGGIIGFTGSFAGTFESIIRFQHITMAAIGLLMIFMGLGISGVLSFSSVPGNGRSVTGPWVSRIINSVFVFISKSGTPGSLYATGMVTGFIPCGLLYTAYIAAAGAGAESRSAAEGLIKGMVMLFLFGVGTSPALLFIGRMVSLKGELIRRRLYSVSGLLMVIIGTLFIYRAFGY